MDSRETFAVGARLLAIFFAVLAFSALATLPATWEALAANEDVRSAWPFVLGPAVGAIIYLLASILLWWRHPISESSGHTRVAAAEFYAVLLSLMGVYLVITNLPGLVESLIQAALVESTFLMAGAHAVPDALGVSIGILLVVRAKRLSAVLAPD